MVAACEHAEPTPGPPVPGQPAAQPLAGPHDIVPGDWIVIHPKRQAPFVLSREEYIARRRTGEHLPTGSSLEKKPPDLLSVRSPIRVGAGRLKTFMFEDVAVRRMYLSSGAAEVYWTRPYLIHRREADGSISEHQGADVYILGVASGPAELDVELPDGSTRRIALDVEPAHPPAATRTLQEARPPA